MNNNSPLFLAFRRFRRHKLAIFSVCVLLTMILAVVFAPLFEMWLGVGANDVELGRKDGGIRVVGKGGVRLVESGGHHAKCGSCNGENGEGGVAFQSIGKGVRELPSEEGAK